MIFFVLAKDRGKQKAGGMRARDGTLEAAGGERGVLLESTFECWGGFCLQVVILEGARGGGGALLIGRWGIVINVGMRIASRSMIGDGMMCIFLPNRSAHPHAPSRVCSHHINSGAQCQGTARLKSAIMIR